MPNATPHRSSLTYRYVWLIPCLWLSHAGLGVCFKGGEHITMAVTWLPAIAVAVPLKLMGSSTEDLALILSLGLFLTTALGLLLDLLKFQLRKFTACFLIGLCAGFLLRASTFIADGGRNSWEAAYGRMDVGRWDRVVALILLVLALGFYLGVLLSFGAALLQKLQGRRSAQALPNAIRE